MSTHSAQASFLGYEYQALQALLLIAPSGHDSEVYLERFDDVTFHEGDHKQVLQMKFSLNNDRNITSKDEALWKTIRNWIDIIELGLVSTDEYQFIIITTRKTDDELILQLTEEPNTRDKKEILESLISIAKEIHNDQIKDAIDKFLKLDPVKQRKLVDKIKILTSQPDIVEIQAEIEKHLSGYTRPEFKENFFYAVYGWWYTEILNRLAGNVNEPLTSQSLIEVMTRLRDLQMAGTLPTHFDDAKLTDNIFNAYKASRFVEQLNLIRIETPEIFKAILNFYKASEQRSKWFRELHNTAYFLEKYDEELKEKWDGQFSKTLRKAKNDGAVTTEDLVPYGIENYEWMNNSNYYPDLKLENSLSKIWLWKGSFHMLADFCKVGWHPDFKKIFKCEEK